MFWILFNKKMKQEKKEYFYSTPLQKNFFDEKHPKTSLNSIIKKN